MSKRNKPIHAAAEPMAVAQPASTANAEMFTFGEPVPVIDKSQVLDYIECWSNGRFYETPISFDGLAQAFRASVHHSSAIYVKRNLLASTFIPHALLSRDEFSGLVLDFLTFGNAYLENVKNRLGGPLKLKRAMAKYTRRCALDLDQYVYVHGWKEEHEFVPGTVFHFLEPDINQEIYGLPEYLSTLQSAFLNESATLFRRKYYLNGSHAGFILYMTDAAQSQTDIDALRTSLKSSKGPGNFRNVFMYAPGGKKDGIQLIPVSEVAAKDEFFNIKNVTRDDILAAHRVPPQLMGIIPTNTGGFGAVKPAAEIFIKNELEPLQARFTAFNEWFGEDVIRFKEYQIQGE